MVLWMKSLQEAFVKLIQFLRVMIKRTSITMDKAPLMAVTMTNSQY